jgi:hypothetical protein
MPHPDYRIVDVPLRLDQVADLMHLVDEAVATGQRSAERMAGPQAALLGSLPEDSPHLRPGPQHRLYAELGVNR